MLWAPFLLLHAQFSVFNTPFLYSRSVTRLLIYFIIFFFFPSMFFYLPLNLLKRWSDFLAPHGSPGASGESPGGAWVKFRCGGWFPLMKYQYVTLVIYCRLTKHDTILSKLGNVFVCVSAVFSPCDDIKAWTERGDSTVFHCAIKKLIIIYCSALWRLDEKSSKRV